MSSPATSNSPARILVVDDHPMVRFALTRLIKGQRDLECVGEAGSVAETQVEVAKHKPDLIVLDLRLKNEDGLELIKSLKAQFSNVRILILSQHESPIYVERALHAGAMGYVIKEQAAAEVLSAIRTVLAGEVYLNRGMAARLLHKFVGNTSKGSRLGAESLTDRELHVLQLLGTGLSTRKIAAELRLSFKTIETHRENIKRKLGLTNASQLMHYAAEWAREQVSLPQTALEDQQPGDDQMQS